MKHSDYKELEQLILQGQTAIMSGTLNEWQHANTSIFCLLGEYILDLNSRLARAYPSTNQSTIAASEAIDGI